MRRSILVLAVCVLAACSANVAGRGGAWETFRGQQLGLQFDYPQSLEERTGAIDQTVTELTGETSSIWVQVKEYDVPSDGTDDWFVPKRLHTDIGLASFLDQEIADELPAQLVRTGTFLPVRFDAPVIANVKRLPNGSTAIAAIGLGRPFETVPFLQSMILVLRDHDAVILWNVVPNLALPPRIRTLIETYTQDHPDLAYPNERFDELSLLVENELKNMFDRHSDDLEKGWIFLDKVLQSMT